MASASTTHYTVMQAARLAGLTSKGIRYHGEEGAFKIARGRIARAEFDAWLTARDETDTKGIREATARERLRKLKAERQTAEMDADEQAGRLLQASRVAEVWQAATKSLRDNLLALHSTIQGRFPDLRTEVGEEIRRQVRQLLSDFAEQSKV